MVWVVMVGVMVVMVMMVVILLIYCLELSALRYHSCSFLFFELLLLLQPRGLKIQSELSKVIPFSIF